MKDYNNIIFDLDGTLTNPKEGILNSLQYALDRMQFKELPDEIPVGFIGPPLQKGFSEIFGFNERNTELAVHYFREYYGTKGLYENIPYSGIEDVLSTLSNFGKRLYIATSKYEKYAWEVIRYFELDKYFDDLQGAEYSGNHTKAQLIAKLIQNYRLDLGDTLMIGDTTFDIIGAKTAGIDCLAVGYGFGNQQELLVENPTNFVSDMEDLFEFFT